MRKFISLLVVALLPALASAGDVAELMDVRAEVRPVVSVIALSEDQARELAKVRGEYQVLKAQLDAEYEARLDTVLVGTPGAS